MVAARLTDIADRKLTFKVLKKVDVGEEIEVEVRSEDLVKFIKREDFLQLLKSFLRTVDLVESPSLSETLTNLVGAKVDPIFTSLTNSTREAMRAKMAAAGILGSVELPPNMHIPTDEELRAAQERTAALTAQHGGLRMDQIIDEERGPK